LFKTFLYDFNYRFFAIYPPTFLETYSQWWKDRSSNGSLSPSFTCLLLRVLACSSQFPTPELESQIQDVLGMSCQAFTEKLHDATEELSVTFRPGEGDLNQVQQLFHAVIWLKSESRFVESWHVCASAIQLAQELGKSHSNVGAMT
jgi:hypothetical protein